MFAFLRRLAEAVAKFGKPAVDWVWRNSQKAWRMYTNGVGFNEIVDFIGGLVQ